jgi:hypothetical protein
LAPPPRATSLRPTPRGFPLAKSASRSRVSPSRDRAKAPPKAKASPSLRKRRPAAETGALAEIVARVSDWAGGPRQALAWCREVGIPALGGCTAAELVAAGEAPSVMAFLDHIAVGGFA